MKYTLIIGAAIATVVAAGSAAVAKQYVDYVPQKGAWEINAIEVDPNHVDEYLVGLRKTQVPVFEVLKAHGLIDDYKFLVRTNYSKGSPNVLIESHVVSMATMDPDQARDEAIEKEILAKTPEAEGKAAVASYEKYRTFVDDGLWVDTKMK